MTIVAFRGITSTTLSWPKRPRSAFREIAACVRSTRPGSVHGDDLHDRAWFCSRPANEVFQGVDPVNGTELFLEGIERRIWDPAMATALWGAHE